MCNFNCQYSVEWATKIQLKKFINQAEFLLYSSLETYLFKLNNQMSFSRVEPT